MTEKKTATILTHAQSNPKEFHGMVNPPVHRGSTIVFEKFEDFDRVDSLPYIYGRYGTPTSDAFEKAMAAIEGAHAAVSAGSGLSAIVATLTAFAAAGDHILISDSVYGPTRKYAVNVLSRFGVEVQFFDPMIGAGIKTLFKKTTKVVFMEAPASLSFEVQDIGAIVASAKTAGITTIMDNSWATPLHCKPLSLGVDVSVMSATKYICGHSDAMLGVASCTKETWDRVKQSFAGMGLCAGSEELYVGLRGLRTLSVRMKAHEKAGLDMAAWLGARPEVAKVLHPALPSCPGHENWKKYFSGASSTFAVILKETDKNKMSKMLNGLELFRMGYSWGGYESLVFPEQPYLTRSATTVPDKSFSLRLHIGFEDLDDLKADLDAGFKRLK